MPSSVTFNTAVPFEGSTVDESTWAEMAGGAAVDGVRLDVDTANTMTPFGDGSGRIAKVRTGSAHVGGHYVKLTTQASIDIPANASGSLRYDLLVARADRTGNTALITTVQGTPAATPVPPALTQTSSTWEIPLAVIRCAAGFTTLLAADVIDRRRFSNHGRLTGGRIGEIIAWPSTTLPTGWFPCDGRLLSKLAYPELFAVVGTTYGADTTTDFRIPDLRGRQWMMPDGGTARTPLVTAVGTAGGSDSASLVTANLPSHTHTVSLTSATGGSHTHTVAHSHTLDQPAGITASSWLAVRLASSTLTLATGTNGNSVTFAANPDTNTATPTTSSHAGHTHTVSGTSAATGSGTEFNVTDHFLGLNAVICAR